MKERQAKRTVLIYCTMLVLFPFCLTDMYARFSSIATELPVSVLHRDSKPTTNLHFFQGSIKENIFQLSQLFPSQYSNS